MNNFQKLSVKEMSTIKGGGPDIDDFEIWWDSKAPDIDDFEIWWDSKAPENKSATKA